MKDFVKQRFLPLLVWQHALGQCCCFGNKRILSAWPHSQDLLNLNQTLNRTAISVHSFCYNTQTSYLSHPLVYLKQKNLLTMGFLEYIIAGWFKTVNSWCDFKSECTSISTYSKITHFIYETLIICRYETKGLLF